MITTATLADGTQQRVERAFRWDVLDGAITLHGTEETPQGDREFKVVAMFEITDGRLRVVSDRFVIVAEPATR